MYTMVIAGKTGWTERFIRWELPLWRGMAYYHAARLMDGERCRWPGRVSPLGKWVQNIRKTLRRIRQKE